jgi:enoyl-CoA hydratase/carnithine racemase
MSVLIDRTPPITRITLNRPDTHNAFDETLIAQLTEAFESLREDEATRVVVVQGAGKSFCAGADLQLDGQDGELQLRRELGGRAAARADVRGD